MLTAVLACCCSDSGSSSAFTTTMPASSWSKIAAAVIRHIPAPMQTSRSATTFMTASPHHRQRTGAVDQTGWLEADLADVAGQSEVREPAQQRRESDTHLHPGQRGTEAMVDTVAKREVPRRAAADVKAVGRVDEAGIPVTRRQREQHE